MTVLILGSLILAHTRMKNAAFRFVNAFEAVWKRIDPEAKRVITGFFATRPGTVHLCYRMDHDMREREPWGRCAWWEDRTILTFLAPFFELITTEEAVQGVIAHELAHCFTQGSGTWTEVEEIEEENTRELVKKWGFGEPGVADFDDWARQVEKWRARKQSCSRFTEALWIGKAGG